MKWTCVLLTLIGALPAGAAELRSCDTYEASAQNVALPWNEAMRSYANGAIRLIHMSTGEPVCCSSHLLVVFPDPEMPGDQCVLISDGPDGEGFAGFDLPDATSTYDPADGLTVTVPALIYGSDARQHIEIIIDQAIGGVDVR